ncbi:membrane anchor subunit of succinate dehydrogenase, Sdh4 [Lobosporangium transversale]|uniref:Succinate dehydrogenase [ubiquinone] cytochrome b small subunit n=1 Tax=Lobosporangium transversale TaxID=64571 RepID=A0A1Y2G827_9FUNG|nr:CybS-domain-containing protein [Lobosporangium transversale]KAF9903197.1 membrane anchor subunit of succinate dehydrogenase, Sdh4 [Lobosporangium transversale]ORZ02065.1 CybS-domain-containing protein [Lobosporangium transversale]|eukprot:XP_021876293.1 CybS-domain-containing protein [Lobosporangium transversale]
MALRLAASPLAMSRSNASFRMATALRSSTALNTRVYFHASRSSASTSGQTSADVTEVYKAPSFKIPAPNQVHGSYHWDFERILSVSMVPLFAASAINGANPITDGLLGVVIPIHSHMGFDAMITDYLHPGKVGVFGNKAISWTLRGATVLTLIGCYQFNTSDVGLTELIFRAWKA